MRSLQNKNRIKSDVKKFNLSPIKFDIGNFFTIIFPRKLKQAKKTTQKTTQKILKLIKDNPSISRKELSKKLGDITSDGIKYHLKN